MPILILGLVGVIGGIIGLGLGWLAHSAVSIAYRRRWLEAVSTIRDSYDDVRWQLRVEHEDSRTVFYAVRGQKKRQLGTVAYLRQHSRNPGQSYAQQMSVQLESATQAVKMMNSVLELEG